MPWQSRLKCKALAKIGGAKLQIVPTQFDKNY